MSLSQEQIQYLRKSASSYKFPATTYDFVTMTSIFHKSMSEVELLIQRDLRSDSNLVVKQALANVIHWGWAQKTGLQAVRRERFLTGVTDDQISEFMILVADNVVPRLQDIYRLGMPEYSGVSFISKILMFLDPINYCTLDKQIADLRNPVGILNVLDTLAFGKSETQIRASLNNEATYNAWRAKCSNISKEYFDNSFRCTDIERAFFALIQKGDIGDARSVLNDS